MHFQGEVRGRDDRLETLPYDRKGADCKTVGMI